jgi:hypothetical protein
MKRNFIFTIIAASVLLTGNSSSQARSSEDISGRWTGNGGFILDIRQDKDKVIGNYMMVFFHGRYMSSIGTIGKNVSEPFFEGKIGETSAEVHFKDLGDPNVTPENAATGTATLTLSTNNGVPTLNWGITNIKGKTLVPSSDTLTKK